MNQVSSLGTRMKEYEELTRVVLPKQYYTILRLDGRAFHTYLSKAVKPFDMDFVEDMAWLTRKLCAEISGTTLAYTQSDEISILIQNLKPETEPWFRGQVQKMVSVAAAAASGYMSVRRLDRDHIEEHRPVMFDARVFNLPSLAEVNNYFMWRQQDTKRNAVSMAAHAAFSHRSLQGKNTPQMITMLADRGIDFYEYPLTVRQGILTYREYGERETTYFDKREQTLKSALTTRSWWESIPAPEFSERVDSYIPRNVPLSLTELDVPVI